MRFPEFLLCTFLLPLFAWAHQPEEGKILATLGQLVYSTNSSKEEVHSPWLGGVGLIAEGNLDNNGGLELAMFYLHKLYVREDADRLIAEKAKRIYVTMGYRHWFNKKFSGAVAFSSGYSMGDPKIVHSDFPKGAQPDTTAGEKAEYGFDFSVLYEIWADQKFGLVLDIRYFQSVTQKDHEDANHYSGMLGYRYLIQEK